MHFACAFGALSYQFLYISASAANEREREAQYVNLGVVLAMILVLISMPLNVRKHGYLPTKHKETDVSVVKCL